MKNYIEVQTIKIGDGIPKICVPIVGRTKEEILEKAEELRKIPADIVEWRSDYFNGTPNSEQVRDILMQLKRILSPKVLLFTFRSVREGGEKEITVEEYIELNKMVVESQTMDLVDMEVETGDEIVRDFIDFAHQHQVKVILSNHDFYQTPSKEEIMGRLSNMIALGGDIPKIAVMPKNQGDVLELLAATLEMKEQAKETPIITMSMSGMGVISRLAGETFGSAVTFGSAGTISAPGQIPVDELSRMLHQIHVAK